MNEVLNLLNSSVIKSLCSEYQSVWLVDIKTMKLIPFQINSDMAIQGSTDMVVKLGDYESARRWYIDTYVSEQDASKVEYSTTAEFVLYKLSNGKPYYVDYVRCVEKTSNYNQLVYLNVCFGDSEQPSHFLMGFRNVDERMRRELDELTGLFTRQAFLQRAEELLQNNPDKQFDLMVSDIVDFKQINEVYGMKVGDEILKWTGDFLISKSYPFTLFARYSADQFVVLSTHEHMEEIRADDNRTFNSEIDLMDLPPFNVKFGIYRNVGRDFTVATFCDYAILALNSIKHQYDKNVAEFDKTFKKKLETQRKIEKTMRASLENEDFKVYYQPKHNALTGDVVGAEALVRWIHPEYGFMSPADFIPLFEQNGFISEVDKFVWAKTCSNIRKWKDKGIETVPISVNASKITFLQNDMQQCLQYEVDKNGIDPSELHVEITETLMTEDVDALIEKLDSLRDAGYRIELDDFGSGYSSINILSTLPIDVVKLDMSFMKQFGDIKRTKVLAACINLAKNLGYSTVSEGVEEQEQRDMLNFLGVDAIQGFFYSKPLPEDEFEEYLRAHPPIRTVS